MDYEEFEALRCIGGGLSACNKSLENLNYTLEMLLNEISKLSDKLDNIGNSNSSVFTDALFYCNKWDFLVPIIK